MADPLVEQIVDHWFRPDPGPDGRALAEEQVRLLFARLRVWLGGETPPIEWRSVAKAPRSPGTFGGPFELASAATLEAAEEAGLTREALMPPDQRIDFITDRVLRLNRAWELAVDRGAEIPTATWPPQAVRGKLFRELENPFEPILAIWNLGYLLEADEDRAVLYARTTQEQA